MLTFPFLPGNNYPPVSIAHHPLQHYTILPCLPLWRVCGRRQTCPAGLCAAPRGEQSLGSCLRAGGRPGRSPRGRTRLFGQAARPPPAACLHWCMCSAREQGMEESVSAQRERAIQVKHLVQEPRKRKERQMKKWRKRTPCLRRWTEKTNGTTSEAKWVSVTERGRERRCIWIEHSAEVRISWIKRFSSAPLGNGSRKCQQFVAVLICSMVHYGNILWHVLLEFKKVH